MKIKQGVRVDISQQPFEVPKDCMFMGHASTPCNVGENCTSVWKDRCCQLVVGPGEQIWSAWPKKFSSWLVGVLLSS
jgi:hypothetical protein